MCLLNVPPRCASSNVPPRCASSMQVLYNCSWFTIWRFILDLRTFVAKSALSRLRALGGSFWQNLVGGGTKTFYRTGLSFSFAGVANVNSIFWPVQPCRRILWTTKNITAMNAIKLFLPISLLQLTSTQLMEKFSILERSSNLDGTSGPKAALQQPQPIPLPMELLIWLLRR